VSEVEGQHRTRNDLGGEEVGGGGRDKIVTRGGISISTNASSEERAERTRKKGGKNLSEEVRYIYPTIASGCEKRGTRKEKVKARDFEFAD